MPLTSHNQRFHSSTTFVCKSWTVKSSNGAQAKVTVDEDNNLIHAAHGYDSQGQTAVYQIMHEYGRVSVLEFVFFLKCITLWTFHHIIIIIALRECTLTTNSCPNTDVVLQFTILDYPHYTDRNVYIMCYIYSFSCMREMENASQRIEISVGRNKFYMKECTLMGMKMKILKNKSN